LALPIAIVVMGVSGCGKTTVGSRLAQRLHWEYAEADTFHSAANVAKMSAGTPLTDEDRWPWLGAIAARIEAARAGGRGCVVACSALKRRYRERLSGGHDDVRFVYLKGDYETVEARLSGRTGHYMPPSLLTSQYEALEEPAADENALVLLIDRPADELVAAIVKELGLATSS
jgi:carbohydrate kinase (thermoresistant glucokinase family)